MSTSDRTVDALGLVRPDPLHQIETELVPGGVLDRLRSLIPRRPLSQREALSVAERQADSLRRHLGFGGQAALPTAALGDLPFVTVTYRDGFPTSGMTTHTDLGWVIVIRGDEAAVRQRFSLAHELKHLLDDPWMHVESGVLIDGLYPDAQGYTRHERTERICDAFAAALLMPKRHLRADWVDGIQSIAALARRYDVSRPAMEVRLKQLGLLPPTPRCAAPAQGERP